MTHEHWRLCTAHPSYLVSDHGRVRRIGGAVLRPQRNTRGYLKVSLGRKMQRLVHTLVAEAFHGPRPAGHDCDHLNFQRHDNRAVNLRWLLSTENAVRWNGTASNGSIIWADRDEPDTYRDPRGHEPMTEQEQADTLAALGRAGW